MDGGGGAADRAASATSPRRSVATAALSGAWLPITFSSAVLLPQRVEAIVTGPSWSSTYAAVSAAGWLAVVVGLTLSGHLRDAGRLRTAADVRTIRLLALAVLVTGCALPFATDVPTLTALWVLALLPAAFSVTLLASRVADAGGNVVASASAIGSAPLVAVFVGAVTVTLAPATGTSRFVLVALLSATAIATGALRPTSGTAGPTAGRGGGDVAPLPVVTDPVVRDAIRRHRRLLGAVTLVDTGTVTLTFAIVPIVFLLPRAAGPAADLDPGLYAERLVLLATVVSLLAVWVAPRVLGLGSRPRLLFVLTALLTAASLVAAPLASAAGLIAVAVAAGLAIGASNAATFGLFLADRSSTTQRATGLGLLNAVPSIPAALVPMVAVPLLRWSPDDGLLLLMVAAAVLATIGSATVPRR